MSSLVKLAEAKLLIDSLNQRLLEKRQEKNRIKKDLVDLDTEIGQIKIDIENSTVEYKKMERDSR